MQLRRAFHVRNGRYPYVIIDHLHACKLDANRDLSEATNEENGRIAWHEYHQFINDAKQDVTAKFGKGFYIDVHGHAHPIDRLEIGYDISIPQLNSPDSAGLFSSEAGGAVGAGGADGGAGR